MTFPYTAGDNGGLSDSADISLAYVADTARGDCNADTRVNAGDFVAIVLELFDTDVSSSWWEIYRQGFAGSPRGCDANADQLILVADILCTVQVIFGNNACTNGVIAAASIGAADAAAATLELGESQVSQGTSPGTHSVPISLDGKGRTIAAAAFTLAWDPATASIDPTDNGADGIPDAVALNLPDGLSAWTVLDNEAGTLQVAVAGLALPLPALADGELAVVTFSSAGGEAPAVTLAAVSLGDAGGANVPVSRPTQLFLPAVLTR